MKQLKPVWLILCGIALVWTAPLAGQGEQPKPLVMTATNLTADSARKAGTERKDAVMARPADVVAYSLAFTNTTGGSVRGVQLVDPLPQGLVYLPGSATATKAVEIDYSTDGGKTYVARPVIVVVENGRRVEKPAPREAYTHIRWTLSGALAPGAQVTAGFEAEVSRSASEAK